MRKSLDVLKKDLEFAAYVMRLLPAVKLGAYRSSWPRLVYTAEELAAQKPKPYVCRPTPDEVARMEKILDWYQCLNAFETKLVWKRSCHVSWKCLSERFKLHRSTLNERYKQSLVKIQTFLDSD